MDGSININLTEFGGVIAALMVVGGILKNALPGFPNRLIPLVILYWFTGTLCIPCIASHKSTAKHPCPVGERWRTVG